MGKYFIFVGVIFIGIGVLYTLLSHFSLWKVGKLPGDFYYRKGNVSFYFPLTTCLLLSLLLTLVFSLFSKK
jgi:hypothetical protein